MTYNLLELKLLSAEEKKSVDKYLGLILVSVLGGFFDFSSDKQQYFSFIKFWANLDQSTK